MEEILPYQFEQELSVYTNKVSNESASEQDSDMSSLVEEVDHEFEIANAKRLKN